jgi:hypothetical protein
MAEEFVEIEQENDPLGILSKKTATPKVQGAAPVNNDPLGILKKKSTPVVSSGIPSQLPSQPSFPQQGYKSALAQGASLSNNSFLKEISKSIPKGPAQPAAPEGKWSNIVQNVFANLELAGTDLAANTLTLVKDLSKNPYIPDVSSAMKQVEESTGKSIPTPWQLDPLGGVIRGLHGNQERMKQVIANNPLPNTFWGKAVSSVSSFAPDIAATALLPEAKLAQGASFLAKTGNLLFNNFTKYMAVKEGLAGYGEARKEGKDIGESSLEAVKGAGRGTKTGMEMALLGAGSNMATKSIMAKAEEAGLTGVKGMATKELVNLGTDVLAFGIVSPFANAALEGRWATGEEIANGTGIAALFRVKGGLENIKSNVELNRALRQTQEVKQGVAISNFVDATPESIIEVYNSPESADMLHLKALVATKKAKETTDLQKKAQYTAEAITFAKASGVKQATDMVIQNKDGFADLKASNDLPESAKKEFLQKAEEINNLLNPLKKQEVDLDNKIKESEDLSSQFSQQAQQSQDPNQRAELEAKAREAKDNADNLRGQLTEVKFNQNRPDANAGKGIPSELIVDVSSIPKETTEPVKLPITEEIPEITVEGTRNGYEVIAGNEANSIGDIRQEAAERRNNGEKFFVKETEKDGKKIFTLVDTTVFDEFGRPGFKSASVTVPENARLSSEALMSKMKDALGVTDKTSLQELDKITSKMMETEVEATPTEVKVTEEVKDLSKSSEVELEKRLLEIEGSKSGTPERDEFNNIDKELEKREWRKVFDSPLDKVSEVADELIKKDKEQQNGFGSYIEQWDARSLKLIANKYSKENVKKLTDSEIIKDYKDAMFGNPTSWYSDGLRLRESVKEAQNRGIDVFKELSKEFVKDGYSEQDAMDMAKRKLEPILKDLKQSSEKPLALEQKPTEVEVTEEVKPTEVKTVEQLRAEEQAELDSKIPNAEQYRVDGKVDRAKLTNEEDIKAFDEVYNKYDELISPLLEKPTQVKQKEEKTFAQKDLDRAEAKKIHSRVAEMEPPSDAAQVALRYLSEGGKVSQGAINEISGTTKRASLNTGRRELKTAEAKARDYASGNESLDDLAHRLWENSGQEISERDIKDALMVEIGSNNTRLDASKAYLERYSPEYQEEQYYNRLAEERKEEFLKEQEELERQLREPLDEQIEGEASVEHINNLIKQYEAEFERENKQLESESKGEANKEISGRDGGKEGLKEEYEKIKSNKKKKDFVRNNLPEEFKPLADELTEAQMSKIVDSNFDLKTIKNIQDAVQKQSAAEVLQRKQEGDGGTGGGRERVEQGKQGNEPTGEGKAKTTEEAQPKGAEEGEVKELKTNDKSILNRINSSENIPDSVKDKFKDDLKYEVKSKEEAKSIAKNIIKEYGTDDAVTLAEANKFHGDVNSFIFSEAINDTYIKESEAKTPEEKLKYAEQWADYAIRFDESARSKGRFISAISDFYKKSPLGIKFVENERRSEDFKKWYKAKESSYKEVFDELVQDPKFKSLIGEEVQKGLKEERAAQRQANRKKIEDFFENAKLKGNNLYAVPIPPKVINGALEIMKQSVLAGESVVYSVNKAIEHISNEVKDWDKEKFRKEYEAKLSSIEGNAGKREKEELPEDAKNKILDKFRKKLKGLDESQKEKVIRKSFKQLVENGALEYNDFKKIIAETIGYGEVTPEEAAKITKLVSDINSVDDLAESIRNEGNRSEQNLLKYQKAKKEAEKSATELNKMVYNKTNVANRLLSIMQLNTLGIPSLVNNPIFNIWNQATVRFPNAVSMTVLDQILYGGSKVSNKLFGTGVLLPENNVLASQKEFFKKGLQGGKLSTEQLFTGLTNKDYFQKEIYSSQIHPFTSIKDLWNWKFNGKSLTPAQVVDKSIQATVGLPAEIVARALNIGDKPQRFAAEGAQAAVFAKNLGLKDIDYKYFLEFPKEEAYRAFKKQGLSDDVAMKKAEEIQERIIKQGEESTFQQENLVNEVINSAVNIASSYGVGAGGVVKAIKTLNMPFLKIPLNASWSVYNLANPQVAFLQSAIYGARAIKSRSASDIQQSKKWLAHGATGIALTGIAGALVSNGIINASNRSDETSKKERQGEKTYEQQNSINVTKLNAYLRGENPDDVKNSLNVDLKWFGNVGNILNIEAIKKEEMTPEQRENGMSFMEDMFSGMSISSMELIENGVFSNTSGLLTAIDKGGNFADSYVLNLINMGTNIVQPAMFAQMSRAQLPYYSQQKADTFMEQLKNNLLTRSSTLRALSGKYPPSQIGVWGDRLDRKDNVAMKLFGISSNNNDNFAQPIYNDYKKTENTAFLPPSVKPEVNGFKLNTSQTNKLETLVGQARKNLVSPFVNDGAKLSGFKNNYSQLSEEDKVKALGIIYKMGYEVGEKQFTDLYPEFYKSDKKTPEEKKESKKSSIFRKSLKKFIR